MSAFENNQISDLNKQADRVGILRAEQLSQDLSREQVPFHQVHIDTQKIVDQHFGSLALVDAGLNKAILSPGEALKEPLAVERVMEIAATKKTNNGLTDQQALQELQGEYDRVKQRMQQDGYQLGLQWGGNFSERNKCYNLASVMGNEIIKDKQAGQLPGFGTAVIGMDTIHQGETSMQAFYSGNGEHNFIEVDAKLADGKIHHFFADPWSDKTFTENQNSITHGAKIQKSQFLYSPT